MAEAATGSKISPTKKYVIIGAIVVALGIAAYFLFFKKAPATPNAPATGAGGTPVAAPPAGMPALSVSHDTTATDDYSITLGSTVLFYTKGDATITQPVDATWSVTTSTSQDGSNSLLVSVLKNGNIVFTQSYV